MFIIDTEKGWSLLCVCYHCYVCVNLAWYISYLITIKHCFIRIVAWASVASIELQELQEQQCCLLYSVVMNIFFSPAKGERSDPHDNWPQYQVSASYARFVLRTRTTNPLNNHSSHYQCGNKSKYNLYSYNLLV